jgi:hypothetical protein
MEESRYPQREPVKLCALDEARGVMVHRFDPGQCRCRCGEKVIRKPVKKSRMKFGQSEDTDFI